MPCLRALFVRIALPMVLSIGCSDDPPPPPPEVTLPPPTSATAPPSAKPRPSASASASASAPRPIASIDAMTGPRKWADFGGPVMKAGLQPATRAWVVMPVSAGWETLKFSLEPVKRSEENEVVVDVPSSNANATLVEVFVPTALTQELRAPDRLAKNDPVMVATSGTRAFGRVLSAEPNASAKVRFRFAGTIEEKDVDPKEIVRLDGTLRFGAPVAYGELKEGDRGERKIFWRPAQFVQSAEEKAWIVTTAGKPLRVALSEVKPMTVHNTFKVGDKLFAARGEELMPGQLAEIIEDGLRYKIKLDSGDETTVGLEAVTFPIK